LDQIKEKEGEKKFEEAAIKPIGAELISIDR